MPELLATHSRIKISFQEKIRSYVNQNGGAATVNPAQIKRPNWEDVVDVINGIKPLSTLSSDCDD